MHWRYSNLGEIIVMSCIYLILAKWCWLQTSRIENIINLAVHLDARHYRTGMNGIIRDECKIPPVNWEIFTWWNHNFMSPVLFLELFKPFSDRRCCERKPCQTTQRIGLLIYCWYAWHIDNLSVQYVHVSCPTILSNAAVTAVACDGGHFTQWL